MDAGHIVLGILVGLEGIAIGILSSRWMQTNLVKRAIRLGKYTKEEAMEIAKEIEDAWKG